MNFIQHLPLRKFELVTGLLVLFFIFFSVFGSRQSRLAGNRALVFDKTYTIQLDQNKNVEELIVMLSNEHIEFDEDDFRWATKLLGWRAFKTGSYEVNGKYSYQSFLSKLALGIQDPVHVVILPGITEQKLVESLSTQLKFDSTEIATILTDSLFLEELGLSNHELLGRMLPETYHMYWTTSAASVVRRILKEFDDQVIYSLSEEVKSKGLEIQDILTMASIVEWEAKIEDEKSIISGLYWNRLNKRMRLEADPTVNFALGERRRLLFEDYKFKHPFNTYLNRGLPPGPITNPSYSSILAALRPMDHDYLYMVANPEGGHEFSRTFEEHQIASEKWRKWLREQYRLKRYNEANNSK